MPHASDRDTHPHDYNGRYRDDTYDAPRMDHRADHRMAEDQYYRGQAPRGSDYRGAHLDSRRDTRDYEMNRDPIQDQHIRDNERLASALRREQEKTDDLNHRLAAIEAQNSADGKTSDKRFKSNKKQSQARGHESERIRGQDSKDQVAANQEDMQNNGQKDSATTNVERKSAGAELKDAGATAKTAIGAAGATVANAARAAVKAPVDAATSVMNGSKKASSKIGTQVSGMRDQLVQSKKGTFLTKQFGKVTDARASMTAWFDFKQLSLQQQGKHTQSKLLGKLRTSIGFFGFAGEKYAINPVLGALGITAAVADWVILPGVILTQGWVAAIPLKILIETTQWSVLFGTYVWKTWSWKKGFIQNIKDVINATRTDAMISRVLVTNGDGKDIKGLREMEAYDKQINSMVKRNQEKNTKRSGQSEEDGEAATDTINSNDPVAEFDTPEKVRNAVFGNLNDFNEGQKHIEDVTLRKDIPQAAPQ